jgi:GntR family transcriptional regulator, transcriptional repressor for pyruvate dehydrogenase complex
VALTDEAIDKIKRMITSGELGPGDRLPREADLADRLGLSRNSLREAVRALSMINVLDVRRGDGTYVTSLAPSLLLGGLGNAVSLMSGNTIVELTEVRRLLEPAATGLAAARITDEELAVVREHLDAMYEAVDDVEKLTVLDAAFHQAVVAATGNETLITLLEGISSRTLRARIWRGNVERGVTAVTLAQHSAIYEALANRDPQVATAAALMHVDTSERWLRDHLSDEDVPPDVVSPGGF